MSTISNSSFPQVETPAQPPNLNLQDIQGLLMIIDMAAQRGAFRGPELSQIGTIFDKVNKFIQAVSPPSNTENNQAEPPSTPPMPQPVQPINPPFSPKIGASI
jgi:hypothetical protein